MSDFLDSKASTSPEPTIFTNQKVVNPPASMIERLEEKSEPPTEEFDLNLDEDSHSTGSGNVSEDLEAEEPPSEEMEEKEDMLSQPLDQKKQARGTYHKFSNDSPVAGNVVKSGQSSHMKRAQSERYAPTFHPRPARNDIAMSERAMSERGFAPSQNTPFIAEHNKDGSNNNAGVYPVGIHQSYLSNLPPLPQSTRDDLTENFVPKAKTSIAVANFRLHSKYDRQWSQQRSRYQMGLLCVVVITIVVVAFMLVPRTITIDSITLSHHQNMVSFVRNSESETQTQYSPMALQPIDIRMQLLSNGSDTTNITVDTFFDIKIRNENYVPLTIKSSLIQFYFSCAQSETCPGDHQSGFGIELGTVDETDHRGIEVNRRSTGVYNANVNHSWIADDTLLDSWLISCNSSQAVGYYLLNILGELTFSYAMRYSDEKSFGLVSIEVRCNGTGFII